MAFLLASRLVFLQVQMLSGKLKIRLSFLAGILSWLLFVFFDLYLLFIEQHQLNVALSKIVPQVFLITLVLSTLAFYRYTISKADSINFIDLLWKVFITGLLTTIGSLLIRFFFYVFARSTISQNPFTVNFLYDILIGLVVIYLVSTFVVWKRLILYQKSKNLIQFWSLFESALLGALVFDLFGNDFLSVNFNIALIFLGILGLILSFNLKWIAYLNFKQKWKSILFILLSGIYLYHFLLNMLNFSETGILHLDLLNRVYFVALFIFILIYAAVAILVTLFNLPTSSVFERKMQEAVDFQKLSQSIPAGQSAEQTYEILLESSMSAVFADAAWLEIADEPRKIVTRGISQKESKDISLSAKQDGIKRILAYDLGSDPMTNKVIGSLDRGDFKSILAMPLMIQNEQIGVLVLLQEVSDAYNREMVAIIRTFVNQACISLENFRLIGEAIENERYKEQLKIAKTVQKSLLPATLEHNSAFEIEAYSMAADEVGGDYYDILEPVPGLHHLIIGDVSGKGTSAAFNMAQMRGIFHSLAQKSSTASCFMIEANQAIGRCLESKSFITAIFIVIETTKKQFSYSRAGHCPAIFYDKSKGEIHELDKNGMGLGILRNSNYNDYVEEETIKYRSGDLLLLYTDGISEAKNPRKQQYGAEGLQRSLKQHLDRSVEGIKEGLIDDLTTFLEGNKLDDDYTLTIVRFK
ncbi:MAG: sigma-B regulation protein RsbU (phosphoserine phosphatase) [Parvicella sp.]|jgi:GAF domain-containing protein